MVLNERHLKCILKEYAEHYTTGLGPIAASSFGRRLAIPLTAIVAVK